MEPMTLLLMGVILMVQLLSSGMIALVVVLALKRVRSGGSLSSGVGPSIWVPHEMMLFVGTIILTVSLIMLVGSVFTKNNPNPSVANKVGLMLGTQVVFYAIFLLLVHFVLRRKQMTWSGAFGFGKCRTGRVLVSAVVGLLAITIPMELLALLSAGIFYYLGLPTEPQDILQIFLKLNDPWLRGGIIMLAVAGAPIFEEILFRGIIYPFLKSRCGFVHGVWITSLLFAVFHLHASSVLPLFGVAVGFTLLYEWTGSLASCILIHSMFNASSLTLLVMHEML